MKLLERIVCFSALLFAVFGLMGELFFPANVRFIFDDLLFPLGVIYLAMVFFKQPEWRWIILAFGAMAVWGGISDLLANGGFRIAPVGMLLRWLKWPIILIAVAEMGGMRLRKDQLENTMRFIFLVLAGLNIFMILDPYDWGQAISELYSPKTEVMLSNYHEFGAFRLSGTMLNPNNNAILFGFFFLYFLHVNARKYWKYILLAFVIIFLTQSRTVLLLVLLIFAFYVVRNSSRRTNLILIPTAAISLTVGLFLVRSTNLMSIFNGTAFQSNSFTLRMEHYNVLFRSEMSELLFGHGIVLNPIETVGFYFDSEYLSVAYQYGGVGLLIWLLAIGSVFFMIFKTNRKSTYSWSLLVFIFGVAATNFTFLNTESATLMMIIVGAWLFGERYDKLNNHPQEETK
ncbi:MAG: O-antigen ligase family protein [Flavobacteriales bacterium]|nr:O-antigen ligase family protein [Flavobacteriales bacterium]